MPWCSHNYWSMVFAERFIIGFQAIGTARIFDSTKIPHANATNNNPRVRKLLEAILQEAGPSNTRPS